MSETLIKGTGKKWYPVPVSVLENHLSTRLQIHPGISSIKNIRKNLAYNLQYLEFLEKALADLNLSGVITNQLQKTYVVTVMGIIEGIFYYLLKESGLFFCREWEKIHNTGGSYAIAGESYKTETITYKKLKNPADNDMKFQDMRRKVEENVLLGNGFHYAALNYFQRLRNRIHLFADTEGDLDTDYWQFSETERKKARLLLLEVLVAVLPSVDVQDEFKFLT